MSLHRHLIKTKTLLITDSLSDLAVPFLQYITRHSRTTHVLLQDDLSKHQRLYGDVHVVSRRMHLGSEQVLDDIVEEMQGDVVMDGINVLFLFHPVAVVLSMLRRFMDKVSGRVVMVYHTDMNTNMDLEDVFLMLFEAKMALGSRVLDCLGCIERDLTKQCTIVHRKSPTKIITEHMGYRLSKGMVLEEWHLKANPQTKEVKQEIEVDTLTEKQKESRDQVQLPFMEAQGKKTLLRSLSSEFSFREQKRLMVVVVEIHSKKVSATFGDDDDLSDEV